VSTCRLGGTLLAVQCSGLSLVMLESQPERQRGWAVCTLGVPESVCGWAVYTLGVLERVCGWAVYTRCARETMWVGGLCVH